MNAKKKVFIIALAVCLIAILSFSTLAWFTDKDTVENEFLVAGSDDQDPDEIFSVDVWENTPEGIEDQDGYTYNDIQPGDKLVDNIKNFEMGTVISAEAVPVQSLQLDHDNQQYVLADLEGYEDVLVTVESPCTLSDEALTTAGGYAVRVGAIAYIRGILAEKYGSEVAENVFIQYGGSMNEKNASELLSMPQIDGGLIGGASLVPEKFQAIVKAK